MMTNRKSTKKALLMSALSLLLCFSMLVGTTFAWFTDSVESGTNQILAGNLDVEVYNSLTVGENKVDSNTKLFNEITYWEPGVVAYENLTVANLGTLALKYQLSVNFTDATATPDGKTLADVLKVGFVEGGIKSTTREGALTEVKAWLPLESFVQSGKLDSAKQDLTNAAVSDTYGIVIYWEPSDKDNDYNMNNGQTTELSINLGIKLVATQLNAEQDSWDESYDEDASYPGEANTAEELIAALTAGKNVKLGKDIDLAGIAWEPIASYSGVFDGNGHTISNLTVNSDAADAGMFASLSGATIKNLKLENVNVTTTGNRAGAVAGQIAKDPNAPQTIIENVTVSGAVNGNYYAGGIVGADRSYNTLIKGCVNAADVTGNQQVGGIVGQANRLTVIDSCSNSGAITADYIIAGGIIGLVAGDDKGGNAHLNVTIRNCANTGVVSDSKGNLVGGIAGAIGRDGGDPIVDTIMAYIVDCTVADGQKLYGAKYNYCSGKNEEIVVITDDNAITSAADLAALGGTKINGTYALLADIDMSGYDVKPIQLTSGADQTLTFIGNGHTISNLNLVQDYQNGMYVSALFNILHSGAELNVNDLTLSNVTSTSENYAAAVVAYNSTSLTINLNNVDVKNATVTAETVAALVSYSTGAVNLTDCDVSNISLTGEVNRPDKVGAYIGTANTATCVVTVADCTNGTTYGDFGRVINGATWNGAQVVTTTEKAQAALDAATPGTVIQLAPGTYGTLTIKNFWGGNYTETGITPITIKGGKGVTVGAIDLNGMNFVTIEGITFDAAQAVQVYAGGASTGYGNIVDSANDTSKSRGANHITVKNCVFTGTPKEIVKGSYEYCPINFMGSNPSSWTYNITVSGCKFLTNAWNFIRMNNVTVHGSVLIEGNTFGGEAYTTGHHAINASANGGDWTIKGNTFINWNSAKCAFATGRSSEAEVTDFVITGNTFSNTRIPTAADGDDGVIEIKTNSYTTTNQTLVFENNTFAGALAGLDETTVKYVKP